MTISLADEPLVDDAIKFEVALDTLPELYNYEAPRIQQNTTTPPVSQSIIDPEDDTMLMEDDENFIHRENE